MTYIYTLYGRKQPVDKSNANILIHSLTHHTTIKHIVNIKQGRTRTNVNLMLVKSYHVICIIRFWMEYSKKGRLKCTRTWAQLVECVCVLVNVIWPSKTRSIKREWERNTTVQLNCLPQTHRERQINWKQMEIIVGWPISKSISQESFFLLMIKQTLYCLL